MSIRLLIKYFEELKFLFVTKEFQNYLFIIFFIVEMYRGNKCQYKSYSFNLML